MGTLVLLMPDMITIGFTITMYICLLKKPIELYHSITCFAVFLISLHIFTNVMKAADRVHGTKSML